MEEEIEDAVGDVKYTDSQKSVATSNLYSVDFYDSLNSCSSDEVNDKINSLSGKETYIIEWDSDNSEKTMHPCRSLLDCTESTPTMTSIRVTDFCYGSNTISSSAGTSVQKCTFVRQETFTQTSKTILELAENEYAARKSTDLKTLETQTSFISITENKTLEYRIQVSSTCSRPKKEIIDITDKALTCKPAIHDIISNSHCESLDDGSSKFLLTETDEITDYNSSDSSHDKMLKIIDDVSTNVLNEERDEMIRAEVPSEMDTILDSEMDEDSLVEGTVKPQPSITEVESLHRKLSESERVEMRLPGAFGEPDIRRYAAMSPLSEESTRKKESSIDDAPPERPAATAEEKDELLFTVNTGMKVKLLKGPDIKKKESFKLPAIQNQSCPTSPHLNSLFAAKSKLSKSGTLPCLYEGARRDSTRDRWEIGNKEMASGEGAFVRDDRRGDRCQLPPIHVEGFKTANVTTETKTNPPPPAPATKEVKMISLPRNYRRDSINIKDKIKELKTVNKIKATKLKCSESTTGSRSISPGSDQPEVHKTSESLDDRACEAVCMEVLRGLHSATWFEVLDTMEDIPRALERFWNIVTETRISDILRQLNAHIDSPRPTLARCACSTMAAILKNTNYTKKPDFYECMTTLLTKTGSYCRPVRRAANVALDDIVCGVDLCHSVTALCVHGAGHKNSLVRCAVARLLVVCCALAGGGRDLLRARPTSAATTRQHALRTLSLLLEDKSTDTRKYAERLYCMLRPLTNFEAYYLTDVDIDIASRQMRKYDQLLLCGPAKEAR